MKAVMRSAAMIIRQRYSLHIWYNIKVRYTETTYETQLCTYAAVRGKHVLTARLGIKIDAYVAFLSAITQFLANSIYS